jgi:hypothetical protein
MIDLMMRLLDSKHWGNFRRRLLRDLARRKGSEKGNTVNSSSVFFSAAFAGMANHRKISLLPALFRP